MRWPWRRKRHPVPYAPAAPEAAPFGPNIEWAACLAHSRRPASTPRWDHIPMAGPYRTIRCTDDDDADVKYARLHDDLPTAIREFARVNFPRHGQCCLLIDDDDQALLAWWDTHRGELDLRFRWVGCKFAFDLLAETDPINAAIWERLAYQEVLSGHS